MRPADVITQLAGEAVYVHSARDGNTAHAAPLVRYGEWVHAVPGGEHGGDELARVIHRVRVGQAVAQVGLYGLIVERLGERFGVG